MKYKNLIQIAESYASDFRDDNFQHQIVAICIKNGKPIAFGINKNRFLKNRSTFKCFCHAEMDLLNKIGENAKGSKIYMYRFNNSEHPNAREAKNAKPCILCQHTLKQVGISKVEYLDDDGQLCILKNRDMISVIGQPHRITFQFTEKYGDKHHNLFRVNNYVQSQ